MIKLEFNQKLFDKHYETIKEELELKINKICIDKVIKRKRKKDDGKFEIYDFLTLSDDDVTYLQGMNLDMLLKSKFLKEITDELGKPAKSSTRYKLLFYIFVTQGYEKFFSQGKNKQKYSAYTFVEKLGLNSCPYCNRNYIFVVRKGKLRPEIDHFYPKTIYPYLAVNFFNLIPSCQTCNKTKSNNIDFDWLNPYDVNENSYRFTYKPKSIDFALLKRDKYNYKSFEIILNTDKAQKNIKLFKLKELYGQHKDVVLEILIKKAYYPKSYIGELVKLGFNEEDIYRYLFSNYKQDKDLHKRPLSKLTKDIVTELKIMKEI